MTLTASDELRLTVTEPDRRDRGLAEAVLLEPAGENLWRVCDRRIASGQGRFIAFIEEKDHQFEVMQIADDFVWTAFATMEVALTHVLQIHAAVVAARPAEQVS